MSGIVFECLEAGQVHLYEPGVLVQVAPEPQNAVPSLHSSISITNETKDSEQVKRIFKKSMTSFLIYYPVSSLIICS